MNISSFTLPGSIWLQIQSQSMQIFLGKRASTPLCLHTIYGHIFSDLGYAAVWLLAIPIHSYHDYYDAHQLQIWNKGDPILALLPSHSQILSHSCG